MSNAQRAAQSQLARDQCGILAKPPPIIGLEIFVATPVASQIYCETGPARELPDNLVPEAPVKTGGVGEQNRRTTAWPLPYGKMVNAKQIHVQ